MIEAICIDDKNRPVEIPVDKWVKVENVYHIIHVTIHPNQNNIQGCFLQEIHLDESCAPYETFRLSRFAINVKDVEALVNLAMLSSSLDKVNIEELIKEEICLL